MSSFPSFSGFRAKHGRTVIQYKTSGKEKDMKILYQMKSYKCRKYYKRNKKRFISVCPYVNRWFIYILNLEKALLPHP